MLFTKFPKQQKVVYIYHTNDVDGLLLIVIPSQTILTHASGAK